MTFFPCPFSSPRPGGPGMRATVIKHKSPTAQRRRAFSMPSSASRTAHKAVDVSAYAAALPEGIAAALEGIAGEIRHAVRRGGGN